MAGLTPPMEGVVRVQLVYTPPEHRGKGYASACVASLSKRIRGEGYRCILYTDLGNPISNAIYRRIGYRAIAERRFQNQAIWMRFNLGVYTLVCAGN